MDGRFRRGFKVSLAAALEIFMSNRAGKECECGLRRRLTDGKKSFKFGMIVFGVGSGYSRRFPQIEYIKLKYNK